MAAAVVRLAGAVSAGDSSSNMIIPEHEQNCAPNAHGSCGEAGEDELELEDDARSSNEIGLDEEASATTEALIPLPGQSITVQQQNCMTSEERLKRSRERNRMHAKKTRQRKKIQMDAMQRRVGDLKEEFKALKQVVQECYTANILLVMSGAREKGNGMSFAPGTATSSSSSPSAIPLNAALMTAHSMADIIGRELMDDERGDDDLDGSGQMMDNFEGSSEDPPQKRARRRGKYTQEERETIRRERNRMHAKRTRDRKKLFLEEAEATIKRMESENVRLRAFMEKHRMFDDSNAVPIPEPIDMPALLKSLDSMDTIEDLNAFDERHAHVRDRNMNPNRLIVCSDGNSVGVSGSPFNPMALPLEFAPAIKMNDQQPSSAVLPSLQQQPMEPANYVASSESLPSISSYDHSSLTSFYAANKFCSLPSEGACSTASTASVGSVGSAGSASSNGNDSNDERQSFVDSEQYKEYYRASQSGASSLASSSEEEDVTRAGRAGEGSRLATQ